MNEWISIKDKVPETYQTVLVFMKRGEMEVRYRIDEEYPNEPEIHNRFVWNGQGICNDITHWMPLPQPPKEEDDERSNQV